MLALALPALASLAFGSQPAFAHARYRSSEPAPNATLDQAPGEVSIAFTEPPAGSARAVVMDGCGTDVSGDTTARGETLIIAVGSGQPGEWLVDYSVISLVDGHPTDGSFSFTVRGSPDCELAEGDRDPEGAPGGAGSMTSAQVILVAVTSALVSVFTMLIVATVRRARAGDDADAS